MKESFDFLFFFRIDGPAEDCPVVCANPRKNQSPRDRLYRNRRGILGPPSPPRASRESRAPPQGRKVFFDDFRKFYYVNMYDNKGSIFIQ